MDKKAQIDSLPSIVIVILITGFIVALGIIVMDKFAVATETTSSQLDIFTNNGTNTLTKVPSVALVSAVDFNGTDISSSVTLSADSVIIAVANSTDTSAPFNITYTYAVNTTASETLRVASVSGIAPITNDWLPIIVIVVIVGVVLALILGAFGNFRRQ